MQIGFEIDNLISTGVHNVTDRDSITKQTPIEGAKEVLDELKKQGHSIVIFTRRDASVALETEAWLSKNKMPYDQIIFGKPRQLAIYFSSECRQFTNWTKAKEELLNYGFLLETKDSLKQKTIQSDLPVQDEKGKVQELKKHE